MAQAVADKLLSTFARSPSAPAICDARERVTRSVPRITPDHERAPLCTDITDRLNDRRVIAEQPP